MRDEKKKKKKKKKEKERQTSFSGVGVKLWPLHTDSPMTGSFSHVARNDGTNAEPAFF